MSNYKDLPDNLKGYIPNFEYLLFDLSDFNKDEVKLQSETMIIIKALSKIRHVSKDEAIKILEEAIELINDTEEKDQVTYYISACIRYILSIRDDISEKEMEKIAGKISIEGGELVMSVAERLRQEGEEKGRQEGRQEGLKKAAKKSIIKGYATEEIADITGLTEKEIEEIRGEMLN